ncbi:MAG: oligosaccharide flippase family protein, partial [Bacteroidales bacterium]|nr:oligosaccharide flippase family protein [Bacteroidales bacterium]
MNRFLRDSGTLLSGSLIAQGIAFLAYLVLGRLFTPDDFGLYNIFYSYIEVLIILSTCKYELAIVIADSDDQAAALTRLTLRLNALFSSLLLLIALLLALFHVTPSSLPPQLYLLIPPMVFFCGTTRVYTFLFNRYKHYRQIATSEV